MKRGQGLKIYLMDGDATGKWSCVLSGETTKAYKVPRTHYKSFVDIAELRGTAVYLLFGEDFDTDRPVVYVGETEDFDCCGYVHQKKPYGEFVRDTLFDSPSAASDFILGNNTSGPREWKTSDGVSMKDVT